MLSKRILCLSVVLVTVALVRGTPACAEYALRWSSGNFTFTSAYNQRVDPFEHVFIGDLDGDGQLEFVGQQFTVARFLEVRDAMTGTLEATIDVTATTGGPFVTWSATVVNMDGVGLPEIVVTLTGNGTTGSQQGLAVYGWNGVAGVATPPSRSGEQLQSAFPNPFSPRTTLSFVANASGSMELDIFDVGGRRVRRFVEPRLNPGEHQVIWEGDDDSGVRLATGTYFYTLKIDGHFVGARKAVLLQ